MDFTMPTTLSTGIEALDNLLAGLWPGDSVLWCVDDGEFFWRFAVPFIHEQRRAGQELVYIGRDPELARSRVGFGLTVVDIPDGAAPEAVGAELRHLVNARGDKAVYLFDDLFAGEPKWPGAEIVDIYKGVCPILFNVGSLAYLNINLFRFSHGDVARLRDIAQVAIEVSCDSGAPTVHPIKVFGRYSRNMFFPHRLTKTGLVADQHVCSDRLCGLLQEKNTELANLRESQDSLQRRYTENEEFLRSVIENSADAIVALDSMDIIRTWNSGAERLFGYRPEDIIGQPITVLIPDDVRKSGELGQIAEALREQGHLSNYRTRRRHRDGRSIEVEITHSRLTGGGGKVIGSAEILRDITESVRFERHLQQAEKMSAIGQVASALGHEIGTPLNVISGNAELMLMDLGEDNPNAVELKAILSEARRVAGLIERLVRFARPGKPLLTPINVNVVVGEILGLMEPQLKKNRIALIRDLAPEELNVIGDADQLKQVFLNITLNASQAMPKGGKFEVHTRRSQGELDPEGATKEVQIVLKDSGEGISDSNLPRIFDPFFSTKPRSEGTGLGLTTSFQIIQSHHGRIEVQSRPGEGAVFTITLPAAEDKRR